MLLEEELTKRFGHASFRSGQKEIITGILSGRHVIGRLPTGSGKSLCYFFLAPHIKGIFLVISPLVALMEDQVYRLKMSGVKNVAALNGLRTAEERRNILSSLNQIKYLFLSPEMLQNRYIQGKLKQIEIGLFVVDEAHCISKWGYDFRSDYLRLQEFLADYKQVRVLALTATATSAVLSDIQTQLNIPDAKIVLSKVNRSNIAILVERAADIDAKYRRLFELVRQLAKPMVIYCNRRKTTVEIYEKLRGMDENQALRVAYFHGALDASAKISLTAQFVTDNIDVMVCTNAFGMGLHKADIRTVIHFTPPLQMESYMQEMGRAGRDGRAACSIVLWTDEDFYQNQSLLLSEMIEKEQVENYLYLKYVCENETEKLKNKTIEYYLDVVLDELKLNRYIKKHTEFIEKNIDFYVEKIYNYIIQRRTFHIEECQFMEQFFREDTICRRVNVLQYFAEDVTDFHAHCCDVCGDCASNYISEDRPTIASLQKNWLEKLHALLLHEKYTSKLDGGVDSFVQS